MSDEDQLLEELRAWHTLALKLQSENELLKAEYNVLGKTFEMFRTDWMKDRDQLKAENQELLAWRRAIVKAVEDSNAYIQKQDRELTELRERNAKLEARIKELESPLTNKTEDT